MTIAFQSQPLPSLIVLQEQHADLVKTIGRSESPEAHALIERFVERCVEAGHVIAAPHDRRVAQSLLSFWAHRLDKIAQRTHRPPETDEPGDDDTEEQTPSDSLLLADFEKDAFNTLVVEPTDRWIDTLDNADQNLVRRLVLRMLSLRKDDHFEAIPTTRVIFDSLEPSEQAERLLHQLIRLGVVRSVRHSIDSEEFSLQQLDYLLGWTHLQQWMAGRRRFRKRVEESLREARPTPMVARFQPLMRVLRSIRIRMTQAGAWLMMVFAKLGHSNREAPQTNDDLLSEADIEEAQYYRDRNSTESKFLYLQRQLERERLDTIHERLFGAVVFAVLFGIFALVTLIQKSQVTQARNLADQQKKVFEIKLAEHQVGEAVADMVRDPSGAVLRSVDSLKKLDENQDILSDDQLELLRNSYQLTRNAAHALATPLIDVKYHDYHKPSDGQTLKDEDLSAALDIENTDSKISANGQVCFWAVLDNNVLWYQRADLDADGKWQRRDLHSLKPKLSGSGKVRVHLSDDGKRAAVAIVSHSNGDGQQVQLYATAMGDTLGPLSDDNTVGSDGLIAGADKSADLPVLTAIDPDGNYLAVGTRLLGSSDSDQPQSQLTLWSLAKREVIKTVVFSGDLWQLAFSKSYQLNAPDTAIQRGVRLAGVCRMPGTNAAPTKENPTVSNVDDGIVVKQWGVTASTLNEVADHKLSGEISGQGAILLYSPSDYQTLFASYAANHFLINSKPNRVSITDNGSNLKIACSVAAFSHDGNCLALGTTDGKLALSEFIGKERTDCKVLTNCTHTERVFGLALSPDDRYVISGSRDKRVLVYDRVAQETVCSPLWHTATVDTVAVSQDGKYLVSINRHVAQSWLFPTAQWRPSTLGLPPGCSTLHMACAENGKIIVGGVLSRENLSCGWVGVYTESTGSLDFERTSPLPIHQVCVSADGKYYAAINLQGNVSIFDDAGKTIWSKAIEKASFATFNLDSRQPMLLVLANQGDQCSVEVVGRTHESETWTSDSRFSKTVPHDLSGARFALLGNEFAAYSKKGHVLHFDSSGSFTHLMRTVKADQDGRAHLEAVTHVAFSEDGKRVASSGEDDYAVVWEIGEQNWQKSGRRLEITDTDPIRRTTANVNYVTFSPDGTRILTANADGRGILWSQKNDRWVPVFNFEATEKAASPSLVSIDFLPLENKDSKSKLQANDKSQKSPAVQDRFFVLCRWSDQRLRVYDTLQILAPQGRDFLVDTRAVADFQASHHVDCLSVNRYGGSIVAMGKSHLETRHAPSDNSFLGSPQPRCSLKVSRWKFDSQSRDEDVQNSVERNERVVTGALSGLILKRRFDFFKAWLQSGRQDNSSNLTDEQYASWHRNEAASSLFSPHALPSCSLWHWDRLASLQPESISTEIELQRIYAYMDLERWSDAEASVAQVIQRQGKTPQTIKLRASLSQKRLANFEISLGLKNSDQLDSVREVIQDLEAVVEQSPEDFIAKYHLQAGYVLVRDYERAVALLNELVELQANGVQPELLKYRAAVLKSWNAHGHESSEALEQEYASHVQAANLFLGAQRYSEAADEFDQAVSLDRLAISRSSDNGVIRKRLCDRLSDFARARLKAEEVGQEMRMVLDPVAALFEACELDSVNIDRIREFLAHCPLNHVRTKVDWRKLDALLEHALQQLGHDDQIATKRVEFLLNANDSTQAARHDIAIAFLDEMEEKGLLTSQRALIQASLYLFRQKPDLAEASLSRAWKRSHDTILGARLALVQLYQQHHAELRQTIVELLAEEHTSHEDINNVLRAISLAPGSEDQVLQIGRMTRSLELHPNKNQANLQTLALVSIQREDTANALKWLSMAIQKEETQRLEARDDPALMISQALTNLLFAIAGGGADKAELAKAQFTQHRSVTPLGNEFSAWVWSRLEYEVVYRQHKSELAL